MNQDAAIPATPSPDEAKQFRGIWLPAGEDHLQRHLITNPMWEGKGTYQWDKLEACMARVPQDRRRLALDVGAHVGLWTRPLCGFFGRVLAVEPVPLHQRLWALNVTDPRAWLLGSALGEKEGTIALHIDPKNSGATHPAAGGEVVANMIALDSLDLPILDFMKIDCEGYEEGVIRGSAATILRCKPVIIVEQKRDHAERAGFAKLGAVDLLTSWGYRLAKEMVGDYIMVPG